MYQIYGIPYCPFCDNAKRLLDRKGIRYNYIDVTKSEEDKKWVEDQKLSETFPKVFSPEGEFIGGFTELKKSFKK